MDSGLGIQELPDLIRSGTVGWKAEGRTGLENCRYSVEVFMDVHDAITSRDYRSITFMPLGLR